MDDLHKKKEVLTDWLNKFKQAQSFSIDISQILELTEKQIEIVDNVPKGFDNVKLDLTGLFSSDLNYIEKTMPTITAPSFYLDSSLIAMSASGSTSGYGYIQDLYNSDENLCNWQKKALRDFEIIQENQNRFNKIIEIVMLFDTVIANELSEAKNKYQQFKQGLVSAEDIALALRNPMEHLKGRLWERTLKIYKAETTKNLNSKFLWTTIAEFAVKNGKDSEEYFEFINRSNDFVELWSFLSSLLKKCATYTDDYIREQLVKYIDTLFTMLNLADIEKIKNAL
jgi:hypothetical protein